jgi:23S rRNA (guanosine2251-2'-O)-methyltransferase
MARKNKTKSGGSPNRPRFWGKHAVAAALDNPERKVSAPGRPTTQPS